MSVKIISEAVSAAQKLRAAEQKRRQEWENSTARFAALVSTAADDGWRTLCAQPVGACHMYFVPSKGKEWGSLRVIHEDDDASGWTLAEAQRVPGDRTREGLHSWLSERARRLPLLPVE